MKKITNVLRDLRDQHRKTQDYMASRLGMSQSQYNKIEKGDKALDFDTLSAIAKVFGINPKQLFQAIYDEDVIRPVHTVIGTTADREAPAEESQDSYYKKMAFYFEKKFLKTYRMYIEIVNKYRVDIPEAS
jgi:transcriptional regulator with XRE-family HTH domain